LDCVSLDCIFDIVGKPLARRDARALFCGIWTYHMKVIEFGRFYELKVIEF